MTWLVGQGCSYDLVMPADRSALGAFLRSRRDALTPAQAGIDAFPGPRRVPGLRKEELAVLAGLSPDHYSRLEQAASTPSPTRFSRRCLVRCASTTSNVPTCMISPRRPPAAAGRPPSRPRGPTRACCG